MANSSAILPLTPFDRIFERSSFVTGWLVEGTVDLVPLGAAIERLTEKWRMLAGRLQTVGEGQATSWQLEIPLGPIAPDHKTYSLTTTVSDFPISHFIPLPLPFHSPSLPSSLFVDPGVPRQYATYIGQPLTWWHVTHFAPEQDGTVHSAIGFARCHGIFDGVGAAAIMRGLVAEMNNVAWNVPELPSPGLNDNPVLNILEARQHSRAASTMDYQARSGLIPMRVSGMLWMAGWHLREKLLRGATRQIFIIPKEALSSLVDGTRNNLQQDGKDGVKISTGDIIVAWLMKTVYAETSPSTAVHCSNIASFRSFLPSEGNTLEDYPHNAWVPIPYPPLTARDINLLPTSELARRLGASRMAMDMYDVIAAYKTLQDVPFSVPGNSQANETLVVSNVSASKIMESDWSAIGGLKTVCSYRYSLTPLDLLIANTVYISGRLPDGSVVLDVTFNTSRMELLIKETARLIASAEASH